MADLRFEWDPAKDHANRRKHKVSFGEAETVFSDEHARLLDDPEHSHAEDRFVLLGLSSRFRVLVVVHTYRGTEDIIRLISARRATKAERAYYDARWQR
ncbi:MAG: BrnT family toxin [Gemmatimonadales bacterium]